MITRLEHLQSAAHTWTFNDRINHNYFNWVQLTSPFIINLYWKECDDGATQFIGSYNLDLATLHSTGYVRIDAEYPNKVLLRFQRNNDNKIQIAINNGSKAADCGIVLRD